MCNVETNNEDDGSDEDITLEEIRRKRNKISKIVRELKTTYNPGKKVRRALKKLETSYNPFPNKGQESANLMIDDEICFIKVEDGEPITFDDAWFNEKEEDRKKWRTAIKKEIGCMHEKGVWEDMTKVKFDKLNPKDQRKRPIG